jgi:hypothetical protein
MDQAVRFEIGKNVVTQMSFEPLAYEFHSLTLGINFHIYLDFNMGATAYITKIII